MTGHAQRAFAYAHLAAGRAGDAVEAARIAIEIFERTEKLHTGMAATLLAEALLLAGDLPGAESAANEAIAYCRRSLRGNFEVLAQGVLARALLRQRGPAARADTEAAIAQAAALVERTGAATLAPSLLEWRAELAGVLGDTAARERSLQEARRGYEATGASKQVQRMTREIGF